MFYIKSLCCLCLSDKEELKIINGSDPCDAQLINKMNSCALNLEWTEINFPMYICYSCYCMLDILHEFKILADKNINLLRGYILQLKQIALGQYSQFVPNKTISDEFKRIEENFMRDVGQAQDVSGLVKTVLKICEGRTTNSPGDVPAENNRADSEQKFAHSGRVLTDLGVKYANSGLELANSGPELGSSGQGLGNSEQKKGNSGQELGSSGQDLENSEQELGNSGKKIADLGQSLADSSQKITGVEMCTNRTEKTTEDTRDKVGVAGKNPNIISEAMETNVLGTEKSAEYKIQKNTGEVTGIKSLVESTKKFESLPTETSPELISQEVIRLTHFRKGGESTEQSDNRADDATKRQIISECSSLEQNKRLLTEKSPDFFPEAKKICTDSHRTETITQRDKAAKTETAVEQIGTDQNKEREKSPKFPSAAVEKSRNFFLGAKKTCTDSHRAETVTQKDKAAENATGTGTAVEKTGTDQNEREKSPKFPSAAVETGNKTGNNIKSDGGTESEMLSDTECKRNTEENANSADSEDKIGELKEIGSKNPSEIQETRPNSPKARRNSELDKRMDGQNRDSLIETEHLGMFTDPLSEERANDEGATNFIRAEKSSSPAQETRVGSFKRGRSAEHDTKGKDISKKRKTTECNDKSTRVETSGLSDVNENNSLVKSPKFPSGTDVPSSTRSAESQNTTDHSAKTQENKNTQQKCTDSQKSAYNTENNINKPNCSIVPSALVQRTEITPEPNHKRGIIQEKSQETPAPLSEKDKGPEHCEGKSADPSTALISTSSITEPKTADGKKGTSPAPVDILTEKSTDGQQSPVTLENSATRSDSGTDANSGSESSSGDESKTEEDDESETNTESEAEAEAKTKAKEEESRSESESESSSESEYSSSDSDASVILIEKKIETYVIDSSTEDDSSVEYKSGSESKKNCGEEKSSCKKKPDSPSDKKCVDSEKTVAEKNNTNPVSSNFTNRAPISVGVPTERTAANTKPGSVNPTSRAPNPVRDPTDRTAANRSSSEPNRAPNNSSNRTATSIEPQNKKIFHNSRYYSLDWGPDTTNKTPNLAGANSERIASNRHSHDRNTAPSGKNPTSAGNQIKSNRPYNQNRDTVKRTPNVAVPQTGRTGFNRGPSDSNRAADNFCNRAPASTGTQMRKSAPNNLPCTLNRDFNTTIRIPKLAGGQTERNAPKRSGDFNKASSPSGTPAERAAAYNRPCAPNKAPDTVNRAGDQRDRTASNRSSWDLNKASNPTRAPAERAASSSRPCAPNKAIATNRASNLAGAQNERTAPNRSSCDINRSGASNERVATTSGPCAPDRAAIATSRTSTLAGAQTVRNRNSCDLNRAPNSSGVLTELSSSSSRPYAPIRAPIATTRTLNLTGAQNKISDLNRAPNSSGASAERSTSTSGPCTPNRGPIATNNTPSDAPNAPTNASPNLGLACLICLKMFPQAALFQKHFATHPKFVCVTCGSTFSTFDTYDARTCCEMRQDIHIASADQLMNPPKNYANPYFCETCNMFYGKRRNFWLHRLNLHPKNNCKVCGEICESTSKLAEHFFIKHASYEL